MSNQHHEYEFEKNHQAQTDRVKVAQNGQRRRNLQDPDYFLSDHRHRKDIAYGDLQKASNTIQGLMQKELSESELNNAENESHDGNNGNNGINFLKLVTFKKPEKIKSFNLLEEIEKNKKYSKANRMEDVMEDLTDEISKKLNKIRKDSNTPQWIASFKNAVFNKVPTQNNKKITNKNDHDAKQKKVTKIEGLGEEAIELDVHEDYDWN